MNLSLPPKIQQLIDERVKSGKYGSREDVIAAAISNLDQQESFGDFSPGELDALLAEAEADIQSGDLLDADQAFSELRRLSAKRRGKAG